MKAVLSIDAVRHPLTGIGRYVFELARNLHRGDWPDIDLFFQRGGTVFPATDVLLPPGDTIDRRPMILEMASRYGQSLASLMHVERYVRRRRLERVLRSHAGSLFHGPQFYLPEHRGPKVVTIHDLTVFSHPQYHPSGRVAVMRREIRRSLRLADRVIADSDYVRDQIIRFSDVPASRIDTVYLAGASEFRPRAVDEVSDLLKRLGLKYGGYCLMSATIEPRKNIGTLLDAYERLPRDLACAFPLVLCGYYGWQSEDLHRRMERVAGQGWLHYLGYLPAADLSDLFSAARLFAFPSLEEGFGLPVIEAMASGVPVIMSNASCLPEIGGGAAAMCDPYDVDALAALLERGLQDEDWRREMRAKGLVRAAEFSFARCAAETVGVYRSVLE